MNIIKKLKLLKILFNKHTAFYNGGGGRWFFETMIKNKEQTELIKEYINEKNNG